MGWVRSGHASPNFTFRRSSELTTQSITQTPSRGQQEAHGGGHIKTLRLPAVLIFENTRFTAAVHPRLNNTRVSSTSPVFEHLVFSPVSWRTAIAPKNLRFFCWSENFLLPPYASVSVYSPRYTLRPNRMSWGMNANMSSHRCSRIHAKPCGQYSTVDRLSISSPRGNVPIGEGVYISRRRIRLDFTQSFVGCFSNGTATPSCTPAGMFLRPIRDSACGFPWSFVRSGWPTYRMLTT